MVIIGLAIERKRPTDFDIPVHAFLYRRRAIEPIGAYP